jgi:hypothetical protein
MFVAVGGDVGVAVVGDAESGSGGYLRHNGVRWACFLKRNKILKNTTNTCRSA